MKNYKKKHLKKQVFENLSNFKNHDFLIDQSKNISQFDMLKKDRTIFFTEL